MSMDQSEWAARVAEIGKMAGWGGDKIRRGQQSVPGLVATGAMTAMEYGNSQVILAIRQLAADWLAADGVVAVRVCRWTKGQYAYKTGCGSFRSPLDPPPANDMHYCPRCGGKIEVTP